MFWPLPSVSHQDGCHYNEGFVYRSDCLVAGGDMSRTQRRVLEEFLTSNA